MPASCSSKAVSRAPCSRGLVSSTKSRNPYPFSCPRYIGAVAVPYFTAASLPALQWVSSPSPGFTRVSAFSPILRHTSMSSSLMRCASFRSSSFTSSTRQSRLAVLSSTTEAIRSSAQKRFTAVGLDVARYSFAR